MSVVSDYLQYRYTPARVPDQPLALEPPLSLAWSIKANAVHAVVGDRIYVRQLLARGERLLCVDLGGREKWKIPAVTWLAAVTEHGLFISDSSEGAEQLAIVDLSDGRVIRRHRDTGLLIAALRETDTVLLRSRNEGLAMRTLSAKFPIRWQWHPENSQAKMAPAPHIACGAEACFVPSVTDQEARLTALALADGKELWTIAIKGMGDLHEHGAWSTTVANGSVLIDSEKGTAAFDVRNGRRRWYADVEGSRSVYGRFIYKRGTNYQQAGAPSEITAIDLATGRMAWRRSYPELLKRARGNRLTQNFAVSETHIFAGDDIGIVWAFDRATGEPVWHHRPAGPRYFVPWQEPVIAGERLYIATGGEKSVLYCYERAPRTTAR